ncbi:uncharacterized protein [Chironomus tepperi]|uniref:uncharacterized protein n=1 Tax=Chironomus tepperi TaxID=113505 RepID=UPI00391EEE75
MSVNILIIFCGLLWMQNCVDAQSANCDYDIRNFWTYYYLQQDIPNYSCSLHTNIKSSINKVTTINGQHESGHADDDVRYLYISNGISLNTFSSIFCQKFKNLQVIQSDAAAVYTIDGNSLEKCENLEILYLNRAQLNSIPNELLSRNPKLTQIWIISSQVTTLPENLFSSQNNLKYLFLIGNQISLLPSNIFNPLIQLEQLVLRYNKLQSIDPKWFQNLGNLKGLNLGGNQISSVPAAPFGVVLKNLVEIYLDNNKINQIDEKFIDNTAVDTINMRGNICSNAELFEFKEIKVALRTCFENYKTTEKQHVEVTRTQQCGQPVKGVGNIIGGKFATRGDFPWVAVLSTASGEYICGGTLVSKQKVVTAAHCIQNKHAPKPTLAGEVIVRLGIYDLDKKVEVGRASYAVQSINMHPDWNTLTQAFDADIAVLVLDSEVTFSGFIQPICLVRASSASTGVVVGYGVSEDVTKIHENIPKILETPIHSNKDCFKNNEALAGISSGRTFCGGTGTGIGVCRGDSGSGLIVTDGTTYYLRGIVSSSLIGGPYGCDVDTYSVFTDVTKYIDWINNVSTSRFD